MKTLTRSLCTIDKCFADIAVCEHARGTDIVPILTRERVDAENNKYNAKIKKTIGVRNIPGLDNLYIRMYAIVTLIRKTVYNLHLLLQAFLATFGQPLVLANSHDGSVSKLNDPKQAE